MSLDTAATIAKLRGLTRKFDEGVATVSPFYPRLSTIVQSTGANEEYGMLGAMPGVREWLGDRVFKSLRALRFEIENKTWESSIRIEKEDIEDDRLGIYGLPLAELGAEAAMHPDELFFDVLVNGETGVAMDGQTFFDNDHSWGDSGTQDNLLTYNANSHTAVTPTEFKAAYEQAVAQMLTFKNDQGKLLNRPTIGTEGNYMVVVPPALKVAAHTAFDSVIISNSSNVVIDRPTVVTSPYLTSGVKFYTFDMGGLLKPFVFQARRPLRRQMKGLDDLEFKDVKFMTDARYNVGYLAWWKAVLTEFN